MPLPMSARTCLLAACGFAYVTAWSQPEADAIYLATVGTEPTDTVRLFDRAPGDSIAVCTPASSGTVALDSAYGFAYRANAGFRGEDRYCVSVCSRTGPPACDTVDVVVTVIAPADVIDVALTARGGEPFDACVDLPFGGPYAPPAIRSVDSPFAVVGTAADPSCVRLAPTADRPADGVASAIFCSATNPSFCRAVDFAIEVLPACATEVFPADTLVLAAAPTPYAHCLAEGVDLTAYDLFLGGSPYAPRRSSACGAAASPGASGDPVYVYDLRFAPGDGAFALDGWTVAGEGHAADFASLAELADSMTAWDPANAWRYDPDAPELVADGNAGDPGPLVITFDPGDGPTVYVRDERADDLALGDGTVVELGAPGWYRVELVPSDSSCGESQAIYLPPQRRPRRDTVDFVVRADADNPGLCVPLDDLLGQAPTSVEVLALPGRGSLAVEDLRCFAFAAGPGIGRDSATVIHCSAGLGLCDTTVLALALGQRCDSIALTSAPFRQTGDCSAGAGFDFAAAPLARLTDLAVSVGGEPRPFVVDSAGFSVVVPVGRQTITVRDAGRACFLDVDVEVECVACPEPLADTYTFEVTCGAPVQSVCLPIDAATVAEYDVTLDGEAVGGPWVACGDGVRLAVDGRLGGQTLVVARRDNDCSDEIDLVYTCRPEQLLVDTLAVGDERAYCVVPRGLTDEPVSAGPACDGGGEGVLEVTDDAAELGCFAVVALAPGEQRVCYAACDGEGACDTAYFDFVVAYPTSGSLAAVDDSLAAIAEREVTRSLVANDSLTSGDYEVALVDEPRFGVASLSPEGILTYSAPQTSCGAVDSLTYRLCSGAICSTAVARIAVRCEPVVVVGGFSPNGDGVNDHLVVVGLDELASYRLEVFTRWGTRVFEATDYGNDWAGTWEDGSLPDGPHFYVVTYTEADGTSGVTAGCTYLMR